jgi:hypothetical protein
MMLENMLGIGRSSGSLWGRYLVMSVSILNAEKRRWPASRAITNQHGEQEGKVDFNGFHNGVAYISRFKGYKTISPEASLWD